MATKKNTYQAASYYQSKLKNVMARFGVKEGEYTFDYGLRSSYIEFKLKGQLYRFDHSIEKAQKSGQKLTSGSQAFAQLVIALEDLARMAERGIYELQTWIKGMLALPTPTTIPECFRILGFVDYPTSVQLKARWKDLVKIAHPDAGGAVDHFDIVKKAYDQAVHLLSQRDEIVSF
jgi:hypothetical protein